MSVTGASSPAAPNAEPVMTGEQALAVLLAERSPYAVERVEVGGVEHSYFRHAPRTLGQLFAGSLAFADRPFLIYEQERLTYGEVYARAAALAEHLRTHLGVRPGDRVAIAMRNYPEWVVGLIATASIGAIAVALNSWWTGEELSFGLRDSGARVALLDGERFERLEPLRSGLETELLVTRPRGALPAGVTPLADVLEGGGGVEMPSVEVAREADALIMYTSGSTGRPKGAVSTHMAVVGAVLGFEFAVVKRALMTLDDPERHALLLELLGDHERLGGAAVVSFFPDQCVLAGVPLFHVTGCHTMLLPSFRAGRRLVFMRKWDPNEAARIIERERVTQLVGVPTMTWDLINSDEFRRRDTGSLVSLGGGGAARPPEHVRRLQENVPQGAVGTGYGMTETNALGTSISGSDYLARPTSVGRPIEPLVKVKIIDGEGLTLPPHATGEICLRTPTAITGYWNRPRESAEVLVDGWVHTGDVGHVDEDGFVYITDRAKDIVIRGGENIGCAEVEAALATHTAVLEAAVYGVPDDRLGERLHATVVVRRGASVDADGLRAHVRAQLAAYKVPDEIDVTDRPLPRLASQKFDRRALRDAAVAAKAPAGAAP